MEEIPISPRPQSPASPHAEQSEEDRKTAPDDGQVKKNRLRTLTFLGVGLFEVGFVAVVLLLLFGTLNYFNILPVSSVFPNQLGWLPKREVPSGTSQPQNISLKKPPVPLSIPPSLGLSQRAQTDLPQFIKSSLKPSFIPKSFDVKPILDSKGAVLDSNQFNASWNLVEGETISVSTRYNNQGLVEDRNILLVLPQLSNLNLISAPTLTRQYFTQESGGVWKCVALNLGNKTNTKSAICENFWIDSQKVKHGIGVLSPISVNQKTSIFSCQLYPQSLVYSWKSCNFIFKDKGL
jgi:hypothetical protein